MCNIDRVGNGRICLSFIPPGNNGTLLTCEAWPKLARAYTRDLRADPHFCATVLCLYTSEHLTCKSSGA